MPWYRCLVEGENFPLATDGKPGLLGFFTTRWVEARDEAEAEQKCVDLLRNDPSLAHERPADVEPMIFVREIEKFAVRPTATINGGFTFFPMGS